MGRTEKRVSEFQALHTGATGFVMPNAWDAGSAIILAREGFPAIATTSAGIAFSLGKPDYDVRDPRLAVTREEMFARVREIAEASDRPVNGDLEAGWGDEPEAVAETIRIAIDAGLAGGNIEDKRPHGGLYDESLAAERIRAARAMIHSLGSSFVLTARTDALIFSTTDALRAAIRRANLYREAGADVLYAPGVADLESVKTLVREIDGPVNVVIGLGRARMSVPSLLEAGVKRISLGGSIARAALAFVAASARELRDRGTIDFAAGQISQAELNEAFAAARAQT